ncbi:capsid protein [Porprismacovirus porci14]|uniref:Capsid protein n=1 Tax=Porcine associated porprismacovirus TaxID=2496634 RepID=A0A482JPT5_9VIRU|nr:capsid protein [Porcine associated porprismacovirus]QBP37084.1 capsid protein [Porcine associated porprismacovirus]
MVKASVMEIYDLQTNVGKGTVLKVHTPTGNNVKRHLFGHFLQYKRYKYLGAKVSLIPASTLPADPLQLSYEAGDQNIDPRDMVNPILWKHYHGETMTTDVLHVQDQLDYSQKDMVDPYVAGYSVGESNYAQFGTNGVPIDKVYPRALMDTSFRKAGVQTGFSTYVKPFVYNVTSNIQLAPGLSGSDPKFDSSKFMGMPYPGATSQQTIEPITRSGDYLTGPRESGYKSDANLINNGTEPKYRLAFQTSNLVPLGWQDTLSRDFNGSSTVTGGSAIGSSIQNMGDFGIGPNLPDIPMLYILMPPAYKTEFYFRMIIKHYFAFKGFRSCISVQAFPAASITANVPAPAGFYNTGASASAKEVSEMAADLEQGGTDTVTVENGELIEMADGAGGEE